jgi:N6-L-threonylcarbamoyladenine synthase
VSGGHTTLFDCRNAADFRVLGGTIDDAAGEAFDKVATMLGLPYPGGPAIARVAEHGDATAHAFPRSFLRDTNRLQFSFSGLKTAVRYAIAGPGRPDWTEVPLAQKQIADLAASFQAAVVDCLIGKSLQAAAATGYRTLCVGGGVAANRRLREQLQTATRQAGIELHIAPMEMCTDNAVMGAIAIERWRAGQFETLELDVYPGLMR